MSKIEERLKSVLNEINTEHKQKIDQQIYGIFLFGFMMGIMFSYTSLLGYSSGFVTGVIVSNNFPKKLQERIEDLNYIFSNIFNKMKTMIHLKEKAKRV